MIPMFTHFCFLLCACLWVTAFFVWLSTCGRGGHLRQVCEKFLSIHVFTCHYSSILCSFIYLFIGFFTLCACIFLRVFVFGFCQQVAEEAMHGKIYVRGFDREGRPIIHYRPGLEKSFDVEQVWYDAGMVQVL